MTDPGWLLDSSEDEFERALLASAEQDAGSPAARARCIAAMGSAAAIVTTSQASSAALVLVLKAAGLGVVLGAVVSGAAFVASGRGELPSQASTRSERRPQPAPRAAEAGLGGQAPRPAPPPTAADPAPIGTTGTALREAGAKAAPAPRPGVEASSPAAQPAVATKPAADRSLELEVRALDRARQELAASQPRAALQALELYSREFPHGALLPEAVFLRVQALIAAGQRAEASALGRSFLQTHSTGASARKLTELLERERLR